jgi:signal transduction histidine kinase
VPWPYGQALWGILFTALSLAAIGLVGYGAFALQRYLARKAAQEQIAVVSALKVGQIEAWISHEKSAALGLSRGMLLSRPLEDWLAGRPLSLPDRERILASLREVHAIFGYRDVGILTIGGKPLLSSTGLKEGVDRYDNWVLANALLTSRPQLTSVRWDENAVTSTVHLDVLAPMVGKVAGREQVVAVLRLRIDPNRSLFPLVQDWPIPTATAETLLTETQGADVVFLNELRHRKGLALRLMFPMNHPDLLAAQVARGAVDSPLEGKDYLDHQVLGMGRAIPGTQWHVIAKQDLSEIFKELWTRTLLTSLAALGFVTVAFLSIRFWLKERVATQIQGELEGQVRARTSQLQGALLRAQAADRAKSLLLARVGHELLTPLNHIQLHGQLLQDELADRNESAEVGCILDAGRALESLIRQILRHTDLEAGGERVFSVPFSPQHLAEELADHFKPMAERKGLAFERALDAEAPPSWVGDRERTSDILRELLANAVKFTDEGRVILRVTGGPDLCFEVEDTGPGIPLSERERIFQPLEQADGSLTRDHGGVGIGLTVAQQLADLTGGTLSMESPKAGGSLFRLEYLLPLGSAVDAGKAE